MNVLRLVLIVLVVFLDGVTPTSLAADEFSESELRFADSRLIDVIDVYEKVSGKDVVADLEYSYVVNFYSQGKLPRERIVQALESLIQMQGVELQEDTEGKVNLLRTSPGEFHDSPVESFELRLAKTLAGKSSSENLGYIELRNESVFQVLDLFGKIAGKSLIRGPGVDKRGIANLELSNVSSIEVLRAFDALLLEQGYVLTDFDDHFIKVTVRKPRDLSVYQLEGMGVFRRRSVVPTVKSSGVPAVRRVIIPKRGSQD